MRTKTLSLTLLTTIAALNSLGQSGGTAGAGATGGGAAGGGARGGAFAPAAGSATRNQGNSQTAQPGGVNNGQVTPQNPSGIGGNQLGSNTNGLLPGTNQFLPTNSIRNPLLPSTNAFLPTNAFRNPLLPATNRFLPTNANANPLLPPTNRFLGQSNGVPGGVVNTNASLPGFIQTNGVVPRAALGATNFPGAIGQDRAVNGRERSTLVEIRRNLRGVLTTPVATRSVQIQVQGGVVTVLGSVQTMEQKQRVLQTIQATPNVTQVIDQLGITSGPGTQIPNAGVSTLFPNRTLTPTGVTNQFGINPNLAVPNNTVPTNPVSRISNP